LNNVSADYGFEKANMTWLWVLSCSWNASLELSTKIPSRNTVSKRKQLRSQANGQQTADVLSGYVEYATSFGESVVAGITCIQAIASAPFLHRPILHYPVDRQRACAPVVGRKATFPFIPSNHAADDLVSPIVKLTMAVQPPR
jgi:hypothetical protein